MPHRSAKKSARRDKPFVVSLESSFKAIQSATDSDEVLSRVAVSDAVLRQEIPAPRDAKYGIDVCPSEFGIQAAALYCVTDRFCRIFHDSNFTPHIILCRVAHSLC